MTRATRRALGGGTSPSECGDREAGFTLIEVIVALALFALVALAGTAMVDTVLGVQARTAGRIERLTDLQRAMVIVTRDLTEIADAPLTGGPAGVVFGRHGEHGLIGIGYGVSGGTFERLAGKRRQTLLDRVAAARWQFYGVPGGWRDRWPPAPEQARAWPLAVAVDITLAPGRGLHGVLRRVIVLPVRPLAPGEVAS